MKMKSIIQVILFITLLVTGGCGGGNSKSDEFNESGNRMDTQTDHGKTAEDQVVRASPEDVYRKIGNGEAILVCAYEKEEKYRRLQIGGSISLSEFTKKLPAIEMDKEIIFY